MPSMVFAAPVVGIIRGGTGTSTPPIYGKVMVGNSSGGWDYKATSTIGLAPGSIFGDDNTWTGLNLFSKSTSTLGTIDTFWSTTASLTNATTTSFGITGLATPAGTLLAVDASGNIIATSSVSLTPWVENIDAGGYNLTDVGDLGIGTSTPQTALHIASTGWVDTKIRLSSAYDSGGYEYDIKSDGNSLMFESLTSGGETANPNFHFGNYSDSYLFSIFGDGSIQNGSGAVSNYLYGDTEFSADLTVTSTTTSNALELTGASTGIKFQDGSYQYTAYSGQTPWASDIDADAFNLINVGNLGIGTSTPTNAMDIWAGSLGFWSGDPDDVYTIFNGGNELNFMDILGTNILQLTSTEIELGSDGGFAGQIQIGNSNTTYLGLFTDGTPIDVQAGLQILGDGNSTGGLLLGSGSSDYQYIYNDGNNMRLSTTWGAGSNGFEFYTADGEAEEYLIMDLYQKMITAYSTTTLSGPNNYINDLTESGAVWASSTVNTEEQMLPEDVEHGLWEYTPNTDSTTLKLPAVSSLPATFIPTAGDRRIIQLFNATTTAGITVTLDEDSDTDWVLGFAASFVARDAETMNSMMFTRLSDGRIYVETITP